MIGLKKKAIEKTLKNFGLSEKEAELYVLLGKRGPQKGGYVTKQLKMNRGQVYRLLKSLQNKGLVEATFEYPTRYTAIPFEKVIDSFIKSKREEVALIEESKNDLLSDWKKISQTELEPSLERFSVIEGKKKIAYKLSQMIKETNNRFSVALNVSELLRYEQHGAFDSVEHHPPKSNIKFNILTQPLKQNLKALKYLKLKINPILNLRGRNPRIGLPKFSRMAIRDENEIMLFISDVEETKQVCLCTNCKSIIQSFLSILEELWRDSIYIETLISEIETGKSLPNTQIIQDPAKAKTKYHQILYSAKEKVLLVTSEIGLIDLTKNKSQIKKWHDNGVKIKIMSPITVENLDSAQKLLEFCEVKHIPLGYLETTIIDNNHLFQFGYKLKERDLVRRSYFENTFYTNDLDFIKKTKTMLFDIWRKTHTPSSENIRHLAGSLMSPSKASEEHHQVLKKRAFHQNITYSKIGEISEQDVLDKIEKEKELVSNSGKSFQESLRYFGTRAFALIDLPKSFHIPKMIIGVFKDDEVSFTEGQNYMIIDLWLKTKDEYAFVPVAIIQDTPKLLEFRKKKLAGFPAQNNVQLIKKDQFQIHFQGNTLFVGWTVPIPLIESKFVLPPACILFEGYGEIKSGIFTSTTPFGDTFEIWYNSFDSFVTFFHPQTKYVGSGTEGYIDRESYWISRPSKNDKS